MQSTVAGRNASPLLRVDSDVRAWWSCVLVWPLCSSAARSMVCWRLTRSTATSIRWPSRQEARSSPRPARTLTSICALGHRTCLHTACLLTPRAALQAIADLRRLLANEDGALGDLRTILSKAPLPGTLMLTLSACSAAARPQQGARSGVHVSRRAGLVRAAPHRRCGWLMARRPYRTACCCCADVCALSMVSHARQPGVSCSRPWLRC